MTYQNNYRYVTTQLYQAGATANPVIAELPFTNVSFTSQLNSIGTFQGNLLLSGFNSSDYNVSEGTTPGKTALYVFHNTTIVWAGIIWHREWDSSNQILSISAQETLSYFTRRRIIDDKTYTAKDPQYIAEDLINYAQGKSHGNIGLIVNGYSASAYSTNRTYNGYEYKGVYQAIKDLSQGCFDFRTYAQVNGSGLIQTHFQMGSPIVGNAYDDTSTSAPNFQFPGNIVAYRFPEDGISATNTLYGLGYGSNNIRITATAIDSDKIGSGKLWPLLEDTVNYLDIGDTQLVKDLTLGKLNAVSYPPITVQVILPTYIDPNYDPYPGTSYSIGDDARIFIHDDRFPDRIEAIYRIVAIDVQPGENNPDRVTVTLTQPLASGTVS